MRSENIHFSFGRLSAYGRQGLVGYPPERTPNKMTSSGWCLVRAGSVKSIIVDSMYSVYVLRNNNENVYKGMTNNLPQRLREHKKGKTTTTRRMKDIELVYTEEYDTFDDARRRELYFKTAAGKRFLKKMGV